MDAKELLAYLNDLRALKDNVHFQRIMYANYGAVEYLQEQLMNAQPTDTVLVATLQAELKVRSRMQSEYEDCEKMIFKLANKNKPVITKHNEGGLVPPS